MGRIAVIPDWSKGMRSRGLRERGSALSLVSGRERNARDGGELEVLGGLSRVELAYVLLSLLDVAQLDGPESTGMAETLRGMKRVSGWRRGASKTHRTQGCCKGRSVRSRELNGKSEYIPIQDARA